MANQYLHTDQVLWTGYPGVLNDVGRIIPKHDIESDSAYKARSQAGEFVNYYRGAVTAMSGYLSLLSIEGDEWAKTNAIANKLTLLAIRHGACYLLALESPVIIKLGAVVKYEPGKLFVYKSNSEDEITITPGLIVTKSKDGAINQDLISDDKFPVIELKFDDSKTPIYADLARLNEQYYAATANYNYALSFSLHRILWSTGVNSSMNIVKMFTPLTVINLPDNAKLNLLDGGGSGLEMGAEHINKLEQKITSQTLTPFQPVGRSQTVEGAKQDIKTQDAPIKIMLKIRRSLLNELASWAGYWQGISDVDITINQTDDDQAGDPGEAQYIVQAGLAGFLEPIKVQEALARSLSSLNLDD